MDITTTKTATTTLRITSEELERIDRLDRARDAAEGLIDAANLMGADGPTREKAGGLWTSTFQLMIDDDTKVRDVGLLTGLLALLRTPEVLTEALKRAIRDLAAAAELDGALAGPDLSTAAAQPAEQQPA